jgi:sugar O-acyltransferase (sialic acid O-acetyltransferase NeuD family)
MNSLLILGAGGHGKVVADTAAATGQWENIAFLDDQHPSLGAVFNWPVLGCMEEAKKFLSKYDGFCIAVGNNSLRLKLLKLYQAQGFSAPCLVHPTAYISPSASLGPGCVVFAQGVVNPGSQVGEGSIINTGASVDHDCTLGEGVHLCPGVRLAGEVRIGQQTTLGTGSAVIPQINIGSYVMVGAGSVVVADIPDHSTAAGVPAKTIKEHE